MFDLKCSVLAAQSFVFPLISFCRKYVAVFYKEHKAVFQLALTT